jgi:class 3 adenylate cyclase
MDRSWGTREYAESVVRTWGAPSRVDDDRLITWLASYTRRAASPGAAMALSRMNREIDVRPVLSAIHVPTLVLARTEDPDFHVDSTRQMASAIPGARLVEFPGDDHFFWVGDQDALLAEVEKSVKELRDEEAELDRVLATVLFTDIVGSTEIAARLGDAAWRDLLADHYERVREHIARLRGREVKTTGDGQLAIFDAPARAIRCAVAICRTAIEAGLEIRAGINTGEVEVVADNVRGLAVHEAARVMAAARPGEILVSKLTRDLAGAGIDYEDRGAFELKGLAEPRQLFAVKLADS